MRRRLVIFLFLACLGLACDLDRMIQVVPLQETELKESAPGAAQAQEPQPTPTPLPTFTATPLPTPTVTPTPTPSPFLYGLRTTPDERIKDRAFPRHGLIIAFILPLIFFGIPGAILEVMVARYVQPRSTDLTGVLIKAQDGLFINAVVSMTARKSLSLVSLTIRWPRVREVVEKAIEQELIHEALSFTTLSELENGLKQVIERFAGLSIIDELLRDFGVEVLRFNVEIRYPSETIAAINRTAEASAGGQAYVAYARAAHLDPDSSEARQLYKVYEETSGQVDAARNLGGGITSLANILGQNKRSHDLEETDEGEN